MSNSLDKLIVVVAYKGFQDAHRQQSLCNALECRLASD